MHNNRQPPASVPITVQRQHQNNTSEPGQLVQVQLPLGLHLKLRPLALPAPPPPPEVVVAGGRSGYSGRKRRRALEVVGVEQTTSTTKPMDSSLVGQTRVGRANLETWTSGGGGGWQQEAKRVLMLNSMAPPLVQAASRLERRSLLQPAGKPLPAGQTDATTPMSLATDSGKVSQTLTTTMAPLLQDKRSQRHEAQQVSLWGQRQLVDVRLFEPFRHCWLSAS